MEETEPLDPDALRAAAEEVAAATFGPFQDDPTSPFYEAEHLTPRETWDTIASELPRVIVIAYTAGQAQHPLERDDIVEWHKRLFGSTFPSLAGEFHPYDDRAEYPILKGIPGASVSHGEVGAHGSELRNVLFRMCSDFNRQANEERAREEGTFAETIRPAVKLYADFLQAHPFLDGNGRVGFVLLQYALARLDMPHTPVPDGEEFQLALGHALQRSPKRSYEPLTRLIRRILDETR